MSIRSFIFPLAAIFAAQLAAGAATHAPPAKKEAEPPTRPAIQFMRPIKGERFYDLPIFLQVEVTGFHLVPPEKAGAANPPPNTGHIDYNMDDYPIYATDDTQLMIGKTVGMQYLPVGWHVVRAQLMDVNDHPLNPPVLATTSIFSSHPAMPETDHAETGNGPAEMNGQELHKMRNQLKEIEKELHRVQTNSTGYVPTPASSDHAGE